MTTSISSIMELSHQIQQAKDRPEFSKERTHVRIWFRGQSGSGFDLKPRVYRDKIAKTNERERLDTERMLMQDFKLQSGALRDNNATDQELYFLQQHYRMPTRLLDWTTNPLAALFFAVQAPKDDKGKDTDGELFMMDASRFRLDKTGQPRKYKSWDNDREFNNFDDIAEAGHPIFRDAVRIISWFQQSHEQFPDFIIPVRPQYFDIRIGLQRSCFTFHVPKQPVIDTDNNPSLTRFQISKDYKGKIRAELSALGIDAFRVYGDLEHLSETLENAYNLRP
jgi:hypothetical protein